MSKELKSLIKDYPDFPKKGIIFKDVLPILQKPEKFSELIKSMSLNEICQKAEAIISIDARGFIFGSAIAYHSSIPMIVARKPGKLPGKIIKQNYNLEYGENSLSIQEKALKKFKSFVIIDDLLATGGTVNCVAELLKTHNKKITGLLTVVELSNL